MTYYSPKKIRFTLPQAAEYLNVSLSEMFKVMLNLVDVVDDLSQQVHRHEIIDLRDMAKMLGGYSEGTLRNYIRIKSKDGKRGVLIIGRGKNKDVIPVRKIGDRGRGGKWVTYYDIFKKAMGYYELHSILQKINNYREQHPEESIEDAVSFNNILDSDSNNNDLPDNT